MSPRFVVDSITLVRCVDMNFFSSKKSVAKIINFLIIFHPDKEKNSTKFPHSYPPSVKKRFYIYLIFWYTGCWRIDFMHRQRLGVMWFYTQWRCFFMVESSKSSYSRLWISTRWQINTQFFSFFSNGKARGSTGFVAVRIGIFGDVKLFFLECGAL